MKNKLILSILGVLAFVTFAVAEDDQGKSYIMRQPGDMVVTKAVCLRGYLFITAAVGGQMNAGRGVDIVQVFEPTKDEFKRYPPQPVRCQ